MSEPTGGSLPDSPLADRLRSTTAGVHVSGEFLARALRLIQSFRGVDVSQASVELTGQLLYAAVMEDLSKAPFRRNGQAFYDRSIGAAGGVGTFSTDFIRNVSSDPANLKIAIIDEIRVGGGASDFDFGFAKFSTAGGGYPGALPFEFMPEIPPSLQQIPAAALVPVTAGLIPSDALARTGGFPTAVFTAGTQADIIGRDGYGGSGAYTRVALDGAVLWPGEDFFVQQLTANLTFNVNVRGRIFALGQQLGDFR